MPINFRCACGKAFSVKDELAGKRTKCPACAAALTVPAAAGSAEDDAFRLLESAEVPDSPRPAHRGWDVPAPAPRPVVSPPPPAPPPAPAKAKAKAKKKRAPRDEYTGGFRIALSPAVAGGLAAMVGSGLWIAIALQNNAIPLYAPVAFVGGLVAVVRGLFGAPED